MATTPPPGRPFNRPPRPGGFRPSAPQGGDDGDGGQDGSGGRLGGPGPRRPRRPGGKDRFTPRRKVCQFCVDKVREVDYKDFQRLRRYLSDRGKIEPRRKTGTCARHQRSLTTAIKRGRYMALLPYVANQTR
ncbi:MAG: 30S ribosomal protein S18 [Chloroflexi bacterium]|nr:30S ribosomal protein S18 [Chloroflexota bacterium]